MWLAVGVIIRGNGGEVVSVGDREWDVPEAFVNFCQNLVIHPMWK